MEYRSAYRVDAMIKADPDSSHVSLGEGVMYGLFFTEMLSVIFIIVIFANAIARKENKFYLCLGAIIIIQVVALWQLVI